MDRRLAAILIADVAGYSRLMETDEPGTHAALKQRRSAIIEPMVQDHSGRILKTMGDGLLIEFASVVNAVACALGIQERLRDANATLPENRQILLRIGINLGDIIDEGTDIYGDGVNIAARLEAIADPGGICVSSKVHDEVRGKLVFAAEDLGEIQLKNILRPVRAFRISIGSSVKDAEQMRVATHDWPSIAVLPFVNMSGDPEQEYFADGLTEDIITALSRSVTLAVIARTSVFAYKGKTVDIKKIARELDVGYVLEGSVRRVGDRVRVTAQLIDAETGAHVWADKYDGGVDDIFEIQDRITRSVAASTHTQIFSTMHKAASLLEHIASPAYRVALKANSLLFDMTPASFRKAASLIEEALILDPDCAYAHRIRANAFVVQVGTGLLPHTRENLDRGLALAAEALRRAPGDEWCHWLMAFALGEAGRIDEAIAECDVGLDINPNAAMIIGDKGDYLVMAGRPEEAIPLCEQALRLNPRDPIGYWWENSIATAHFIKSDTERALDLSRRVVFRKPDHIRAVIIWAASAGILEREHEMRSALEHCRTNFPELRISNAIPNYIPAFSRQTHNDRILEGLRKAGLPH